jgi:membrane protease YdiL (CAAX protease family)
MRKHNPLTRFISNKRELYASKAEITAIKDSWQPKDQALYDLIYGKEEGQYGIDRYVTYELLRIIDLNISDPDKSFTAADLLGEESRETMEKLEKAGIIETKDKVNFTLSEGFKNEKIYAEVVDTLTKQDNARASNGSIPRFVRYLRDAFLKLTKKESRGNTAAGEAVTGASPATEKQSAGAGRMKTFSFMGKKYTLMHINFIVSSLVLLPITYIAMDSTLGSLPYAVFIAAIIVDYYFARSFQKDNGTDSGQHNAASITESRAGQVVNHKWDYLLTTLYSHRVLIVLLAAGSVLIGGLLDPEIRSLVWFRNMLFLHPLSLHLPIVYYHAIAGPVLEEYMYRRPLIILTSLTKNKTILGAAIIASAALFMGFHLFTFNFSFHALDLLGVFVSALFFGYAGVKFKSIKPSIYSHAFGNLVELFSVFRFVMVPVLLFWPAAVVAGDMMKKRFKKSHKDEDNGNGSDSSASALGNTTFISEIE